MTITHQLLMRLLIDESAYPPDMASEIATALVGLLKKDGRIENLAASARFLDGLANACVQLGAALDDFKDANQVLDEVCEGRNLTFSADERSAVLEAIRAGIDLGHARHHQHEQEHEHEHEHGHHGHEHGHHEHEQDEENEG